MKRRLWIAFGALALGVSITIVLIIGAGPREPKYRGVGLSKWLDGTMARKSRDSMAEMGSVLQSVGPESLPWLVHAFEIYTQKNGHVIARWYWRQYIKHAKAWKWLPRPPDMHWMAARHNAAMLLARLAPGTKYETRVATAMIAAQDADPLARFDNQSILANLGSFTNSPALVIPVLPAGLTNSTTCD